MSHPPDARLPPISFAHAALGAQLQRQSIEIVELVAASKRGVGAKSIRKAVAVLWLSLCCVPLTAIAKAKPGRYLIDAKGETVLDTTTKPTWQRVVAPQTYKWQSAKDTCKALVTAGGGWRLPTVRELRSLIDFGHSDPAIDKMAFPNTPSQFFWSATAYSGSSSSAWGVSFSNGGSYGVGTTSACRVRCVR